MNFLHLTYQEKSSKPSHDDGYLQRRDETRSSLRESSFPPWDSRPRHILPEPLYHDDISKTNNNKAIEQPSEVLWVGFPESLRVDEDSLWTAFSPFGEIESVSTFPGRTYAFVRYKHLDSACRALDNLQGKLFNNPRVHIRFAKNDSGPSNNSRNLINNDPLSPRARTYGHQGSAENFRHDRYHETDRTRRSPRFVDPDGLDDVMRFDRKGAFEQRFQEVGPESGLPGNIYGRRSPLRDRGVGFHDFPHRNNNLSQHQGPVYEDEWDLPEDALVYHGAKKLKSSLVPPEPELPEYPFSESERVKHIFPRPPEFSQLDMVDNNLGHLGYHNHKQQIPVNISQPYDTFQISSVSLPQNNPGEWKRSTPEPSTGEWKWEGIIAKGGTAICRARCFPVGKVLDMILPEFLDCTARTSLEMLSKHYYQAASSWVVFFVPESDADMAFYNEFMNYLGEKERAAVAKLDDKTTLFLVPPSDFSEKILKVPGKLSISGVILRLEQSSSSSVEAALPPPPPPPPPRPDPYNLLVSSLGEASRTSFASPSGQPHPPMGGQPFSNLGKPTSLPGLPPGPIPFHVENTQQDHIYRNPAQSNNFMAQQANDSTNYRPPQTPTLPQYGHQEPGGIQQDQLAQLVSYLGNSRQQGAGVSMGEEFRQLSNNIPDNNYRMPQTLPSPSLQIGSDQHPSSQYRQVQPQFQQQQVPNIAMAPSGQGNMQEETDTDPQKRLQATLELAATLLKQIQQGKP